MTTLLTLVRAAALAGVVVAGGFGTTAAQAAPEDVALLHEYVGTWKGTGGVTGPKGNTEHVNCRLDLVGGNLGKIIFRGRCALSGTTVTMNGAMAFSEAAQQYEAVMTTSVGFTGQAIGVRRGDAIHFDLHEVSQDETGNDMAITSSFSLSGGAIEIGIEVVFADTGDRYVASAPFAR